MKFDLGSFATSRVTLGTSSWALDEPALTQLKAAAVVAAAATEGVGLIDTARVYASADGRASSEQLVGRTVARLGSSSAFVVASKGGHFREGDTYVVDGRPETIRRNCHQSLRALGAERIELYFLHKPDPLVPVADSVGAIAELQHEGKVGHVGVSNVDREQLAEAMTVADVVAVQNHTHLLSPDPLIETCHTAGVLYLAYAPFAGSAEAERVVRSAAVALAARIQQCSPQQLVLALLLGLSPTLLPVVGSRRPASLRSSVSAGRLSITTTETSSIVGELHREFGPR